MKGVVVTLAVAATVAAAFFGLGWGVQKAGLRPASRGARVGANVAGLLLRHRLMTSSISIDGGKADAGMCLHHWFPRRNGKLGRGSLLQLASGGRVLDNGGPVRFQDMPRPKWAPHLILEVACTWNLGSRVAFAAQVDAVRLQNTTLDGRPALRLRLGRIHDPIGHNRFIVDRVKLWVDPATYEPMAVWVQMGKHVGTARIRFRTVTAAIMHDLIPRVEVPGR